MHSRRMCTTRSSSHQGGVPQCMLGYTPWAWARRPPRCGPGDSPPPSVGLRPPRPDPSTSPLGVGLETPLARPLNFPLGVGLKTPLLARLLNFPLGCEPGNLQGMLGYNPLESCCNACWDTTWNACWDTTTNPPPELNHRQM